MKNINLIKKVHRDNLAKVFSRSDIPKETPLVYMLFYRDQAIVVGEGKENRARVITDNIGSITPNHKKAIKVRLYRLYGDEDAEFSAFIIKCESKKEAQTIEKKLHNTIGGNTSDIDPVILEKLFHQLELNSLASIFLRQALCSAFDGISDLKKWRREKIIEDSVWVDICNRLKINYKMPDQCL